MRQVLAVLPLLSICSAGASAEVTDSDPAGFTTVHEVHVDATRERIWQAAIDEVGQWWNGDHTISGDATRMRIDARPLGCFCETVDENAGVVHLTVTAVTPRVMLRLTGGLGPLGLMGVAGNMTWELFDTGDGTRVKFVYAVGGYLDGGLDSVAAPVDYVVGEALARLKAYVETGDADRAKLD